MKTLILILVLFLSGCVTTGQQEYWNRLSTVAIGDTYSQMVEKIGHTPYRAKSYTSANGEIWQYTYLATSTGWTYIFTERNGAIVSIYN